MNKKLWFLVTLLIICGGLSGCALSADANEKAGNENISESENQQESSVYYGIRFDENRNPNAIRHVTAGMNDLNPGDISSIRMGPGMPSYNSYIGIGLEEKDCSTVRRTNTEAIDSIMSELDQIYVEQIEEEVGKYDTVIEFEIHPDHDDYCGTHSFRIKRNTAKNSYLIQAVDMKMEWGKVISGVDSCEKLFELYEKYGARLISYPIFDSPVRYVGQEDGENMRIFPWKDLHPEDIVRIEFLFGEIIEDREMIDRIAGDLKKIICRKNDFDEQREGHGHYSDTTIEMTIVGQDEIGTYELRISRNTPNNIYWISKQKYNPNYMDTDQFQVVDGYKAIEDIWYIYDEYQKAYLGIEDYSQVYR